MTEKVRRSLVYLYAVVPADAPDPPAELAGIDGGALRLLRSGEVAAVVSDVDAETYADEALNARLGDLAWVGERGVTHEAVLDWYAERGGVLPLSLFSLHRSNARVVERLRVDQQRYRATLLRLRGRREWGIKLWRRDEAMEKHLDSLSPSLRALAHEIEQAPPGRRFLLTKKREAMRAEELRAVSRRLAHGAYSALQHAAERAATVPIPADAPDVGRVLVLHAAFLVRDEEFAEFQRRVGEVARNVGGVGIEVEFTGPWPPYHFTEADGA